MTLDRLLCSRLGNCWNIEIVTGERYQASVRVGYENSPSCRKLVDCLNLIRRLSKSGPTDADNGQTENDRVHMHNNLRKHVLRMYRTCLPREGILIRNHKNCSSEDRAFCLNGSLMKTRTIETTLRLKGSSVKGSGRMCEISSFSSSDHRVQARYALFRTRMHARICSDLVHSIPRFLNQYPLRCGHSRVLMGILPNNAKSC